MRFARLDDIGVLRPHGFADTCHVSRDSSGLGDVQSALNDNIASSPIVGLSGVFVARKNAFTVDLNIATDSSGVADILFDRLPLADHEWSRASTIITHIAGRRWLIERRR
jgi:hypothetical protein